MHHKVKAFFRLASYISCFFSRVSRSTLYFEEKVVLLSSALDQV